MTESTILADPFRVRHVIERLNELGIGFAIDDFGAGYGLRVVAEGVETEAMWDALREQGCTLAQGYLISKPVSAADLAPLLVVPVAAA